MCVAHVTDQVHQIVFAKSVELRLYGSIKSTLFQYISFSGSASSKLIKIQMLTDHPLSQGLSIPVHNIQLIHQWQGDLHSNGINAHIFRYCSIIDYSKESHYVESG